jgi:hypothetical protein
LLDKRSSTTADRPPSYLGELVTNGLHMALARFSCVQLHPSSSNSKGNSGFKKST